MSAKKGPVLRDGTAVADLVDLDMREVKLRTLSDQEIYEIEQEKVFGKVWLLLGHDTEIPNPGDFVQRHMGDDSVIVARARDGKVHVSLRLQLTKAAIPRCIRVFIMVGPSNLMESFWAHPLLSSACTDHCVVKMNWA